MAELQIGELVALLLKSPRGIIALVALIGSILALVYLFLIRSATGKKSASSPSRRTSKKLANGDRATPSRTATSKKTPVKKSAASSKSSPQANKQNKTSSNTGKQQNAASKDESTPASTKKDAKGNKVSKVNSVGEVVATRETRNVARQSSTQEDGEWITVAAKKKPRASSGKNKSGDESSPTQTTSKPRVRSR